MESINLIPTILCGGEGSRLWPESRKNDPKPFLKVYKNESFLQQAYKRALSLSDVKKIITVGNKDLYWRIKEEYNALNPTITEHYILEPSARNTAPAIAMACFYAFHYLGQDSVLLILAADHIIKEEENFKQAVSNAISLAQKGKIVTFGIQPTYPETGYGYIQHEGTKILRFVEKPSLEKANEYFDSNQYLWNSGMFCFQAKTMLDELEKNALEIYLNAKNLFFKSEKNTVIKLSNELFEKIPSNSIDYAVMEKTVNASVIPCDLGWSDIGSWDSLKEILPKDHNNNTITNKNFSLSTKNCTVISDKPLALIGLNDLTIVNKDDVLLIVKDGYSQYVKDAYSFMKKENPDLVSSGLITKRPWGNYTILNEGVGFKVKRIEVTPKESLSLQRHKFRSENWVIVQGQGEMIKGKNENSLITSYVSKKDIISIEEMMWHRITNVSENDILIFIETQIGSYLGEDDIERIDDKYGRLN